MPLAQGRAGMSLPQGHVLGFHLEEAGLNPLQVICPHFYLHAQQVDVRFIAALLQGKREQRAWEQGQAMVCAACRKNSISCCRKTILYHQHPTNPTPQI